MSKDAQNKSAQKTIEWDLTCTAQQALQLISESTLRLTPKILVPFWMSFRMLFSSFDNVSQVGGNRFKVWYKLDNWLIPLATAQGTVHQQGSMSHVSGTVDIRPPYSYIPLFGIGSVVAGILLYGIVFVLWFIATDSENTLLIALTSLLLTICVLMTVFGAFRLVGKARINQLEQFMEKTIGQYRCTGHRITEEP